RLGRPRAASGRTRGARGRARRVAAPGARRARDARARVERALRLPGRIPRPVLREAPLSLRAAGARRAADVPRARARGGRARPRARATVRADGDPRMTTVRDALDRALAGERVTD